MLYRLLRFAIGMPPRGDYALLIVSGLNTALLVYWGLVAIAHATAFYRRAEERKRRSADLDRNLAVARLDALRTQIHPHFLFNTLHAIASRIPEDPRGAQDMLGSLGELLRVNLRSAPGHEIRLEEELSLIDRYLDIQRVRLRERLHEERAVAASTLDALVPVLVLQPLVENAIEHGIAKRLPGGTLRIEAHEEGSVLRLVVANDGAADQGNLAESQWNLGLNNTRARLRAMYGDQHALSVTGSAPGRVVAVVSIPLRREPAA
jgi:LytS/YehU family sensor histidine kinase